MAQVTIVKDLHIGGSPEVAQKAFRETYKRPQHKAKTVLLYCLGVKALHQDTKGGTCWSVVIGHFDNAQLLVVSIDVSFQQFHAPGNLSCGIMPYFSCLRVLAATNICPTTIKYQY